MRRLVTQLLGAMLLTVGVSLVIVPVTQQVMLRRALEELPMRFRAPLDARLEPPFRRRIARPVIEAFEPGDAASLIGFWARYRNAQQQGLVLGLLLAVGVSAALASWLARRIARPIAAVSQAAERIAAGETAGSIPVPPERYPAETVQLAKSFNHMADALRRLEAERKQMIADIAHELRNPLATVQFRLEALEDGLLDFNTQELALLKSQIALVTRLVSDLRTLSLADAGQLSLARRPVELRTWLAELIAAQAPRAALAEVAVRLQLTDLPEVCLACIDPDRMTQVLGNLLDNALRVTPSGSQITVALGKTADSWRIAVCDEGPGIAPEALEQLFERFRGKRRDSGGSGLGLAIVKALVELHGGRVTAFNRESGGACFEVYLPKHDLNTPCSLAKYPSDRIAERG